MVLAGHARALSCCRARRRWWAGGDSQRRGPPPDGAGAAPRPPPPEDSGGGGAAPSSSDRAGADLAGLQGEGGLGEFRDHVGLLEEAQVAALLGAGSGGEALRHLAEVG